MPLKNLDETKKCKFKAIENDPTLISADLRSELHLYVNSKATAIIDTFLGNSGLHTQLDFRIELHHQPIVGAIT